MNGICKFLSHKYTVTRGFVLFFVAVALLLQLLWPAFANSWTGTFIVVGAYISIAVAWRLARRTVKQEPDDGGFFDRAHSR